MSVRPLWLESTTLPADGAPLRLKTGATGEVEEGAAAAPWTTLSVGDTGATLVNNARHLVNTTGGAMSLYLPGSPSAGANVRLLDAVRTWVSNNCTVLRNGALIEGATDDLVLDVSGACVELVYSGAAFGWRVILTP